jgi:hypothetical protein
MNSKKRSGISRREFARGAALVSAASFVPAAAVPVHSASPAPCLEQAAGTPKLSPESQAEAEARFQAIMNMYGSRFSDAQKNDLHRLCLAAQAPLDRLRAYTIENGDGPALYLKPLVEREKKTEAAATPRAAAPTSTKP